MGTFNITLDHAHAIVAQRARIAGFARNATNLWATEIMSEIDQFSVMRANDDEYWARLTIIKAILSPGAKLDKNISAAHNVHHLMMTTHTTPSYDDVADVLRGVPYGTQCYGSNVKSLLASWEIIRDANDETMNWAVMEALCKAKVLHGLAQKTRSWALALYDANNRVITLDRHMLQGMLALAGIDVGPNCKDVSLGKQAYNLLRDMMLSIVDEELSGAYNPLTVQWAMWNEFRHAGKHASHAGLSA